jgi:transposase
MKHDNDLPTTDTTEIKLLIDRVKQGKLDQGDAQLIEKLLSFLLTLINLLHGKNTPMRRLKELLFDLKKRTSNKSQADKKDEQQESSRGSKPPTGDGTSKESASTEACEEQATIKPAKRARKPGHGRRPASDYTGARVVRLDHPELLTGDPCPEPGCEGQLHQLKQPQVTIYLRGQPVINATKYERPLLRCSDCFTSYVAELPEDVKRDEKNGKPEKYDETADVAIALYKYGGGMPFYRQEKLQESCGVPLPASVQFERCEEVAKACHPIYRYLVELAANGKVHHIDDTRVRILSCYQEDKHRSEKERRSTHTSGIVVKDEAGHKIALYFSGRQHAGENLDDVLAKRLPGLALPIKMSDALAANGRGLILHTRQMVDMGY